MHLLAVPLPHVDTAQNDSVAQQIQKMAMKHFRNIFCTFGSFNYINYFVYLLEMRFRIHTLTKIVTVYSYSLLRE